MAAAIVISRHAKTRIAERLTGLVDDPLGWSASTVREAVDADALTRRIDRRIFDTAHAAPTGSSRFVRARVAGRAVCFVLDQRNGSWHVITVLTAQSRAAAKRAADAYKGHHGGKNGTGHRHRRQRDV